MAIHLSNPNVWIVKVSGDKYLLLAPSAQEAKRLAKLLDADASVERSGMPLLVVEEDVLSGGMEYLEDRQREAHQSSWR